MVHPIDKPHPHEARIDRSHAAEPWIDKLADFRWLVGYALLFGLAHSQRVLFTGNQNTKFISGLALANYQHLAEDWMATITDPFPIFSFLLHWQYQLFGLPIGVHGAFLLILGLYSMSAILLAKGLFIREKLPAQKIFIFGFVWLLTHSLATRHFWLSFFPPGLGGQYLLGEYYEPAGFGVFLLAGMVAYRAKNTALAIFCFVLPPLFHPAYLISSALIAAAVVVVPANRSLGIPLRRRLIFWSVATAVILAYAAWSANLLSAGDPALRDQAHRILAETRIPHHAMPSAWDPEKVAFFFGTGFAAAWYARKHFLGQVLCTMLIVVATTILWAIVDFNPTVAVAAPWRVSVFLAPLTWIIWTVAVSRGVAHLLTQWGLTHPRTLKRGAIAAIGLALIVTISGAANTIRGYQSKVNSDYYALSKFLAEYHEPGYQYLIPPNRKNIRLAAGVPVLATWKSHPTKDSEFLQWYDRVTAAEALYSQPAEQMETAVVSLRDRYPVTHLVWPESSGSFPLFNLGTQVYSDEYFSVWELREVSS